MSQSDLYASSQQKIKTIEFTHMTFNDFKSRLDMQSEWISQSLSSIGPKKLLIDLMSLCKIQVSPQETKNFSKELKKFMWIPEKQYLSIEFTALLYSWYQICHSTQDLRSKLMQTISELEEMQFERLPAYENNCIEILLVTLKAKLKEMPNYNIRDEQFEDRCIAGLHQIFNYYSKQQFLLGKSPTFDNIKTNTEVLTIGKFIRFCKDFKIIVEEDKNQMKKILKIVRNAFIQSAECGRNMHEHHFIHALELLADKFFDKEYDKVHNTSWEFISSSDKKRKLYEFLECHEPNLYGVKLRGNIPHFGVDPYDRIPDYDLSKKYKPHPQKLKHMKAEIQEWKYKKTLEKGAEIQGNSERKYANKKRLKDVAAERNKEGKDTEKEGKNMKKIDAQQSLKWRDLQKMNLEEVNDSEFIFDKDEHAENDSSTELPYKYVGNTTKNRNLNIDLMKSLSVPKLPKEENNEKVISEKKIKTDRAPFTKKRYGKKL